MNAPSYRPRAGLTADFPGVAVCDPAGRILTTNAAFPQALGLQRESAAPGRPFAALVAEVEASGRFAGQERVLALPPGPDQPRLLRDLHTGRTLEVSAECLPEGGWCLTLMPAAPPHQAASDCLPPGLLHDILRHIPHGISVFGPDDRLMLVNDGYRQLLEGAPGDVGDLFDDVVAARRDAGEYVVPDAADYVARLHAVRPGSPHARRRRRPDGTALEIRTVLLPDGGRVSVMADITPLVAAESELARRTAALDAMMAQVRHGIVLWDSARRIVAANAITAMLFGAPASLMVPGRSLDEVVDSALERGSLGTGAAAQTRAQALRDQDRRQPYCECRFTRTGRTLEVRSDPVAGGGFVTTYVDITERTEVEHALRLGKATAESANAAKSRFLAGMSTELRAPLDVILEQAAAAARSLAGRQRMPALDLIDESARALRGLVDTILDLARLESGRFDLAADRVEIPQLIRTVLRRLDPAAAAAEIALLVDLPETLPALLGDERRLVLALTHVVASAIATTEASGSVTIAARQDWSTGGLAIEVAGSGPGLSGPGLDDAFEPFRHGVPQGPGSGLGLYIGRSVLQVHGGDIVLRPVDGAGTAATLHLPAARVVQDGSAIPT